MSYIASPEHASQYLLFRPRPPLEMISKILDYLGDQRKVAADVGCGSGQTTALLAPHFKEIFAVDSDAEQIKNAKIALKDFDNIKFHVCSADELPVDDCSVDLITGVQCVHWFDVGSFYREAERAVRPGGALAIAGYRPPIVTTLPTGYDVTPNIVELLNTTYGECMPTGSRIAYMDNYRSEPFIRAPFSAQPYLREDFETEPKEIELKDLLGYIRTWSTYHKYIKKYGEKTAEEELHNFSSKIPSGEKLFIKFSYFLLLCRKG